MVNSFNSWTRPKDSGAIVLIVFVVFLIDCCFLAKNLQGWGKNCTFVTIKVVKTTNYTNYAFILSGYSY